MSIFAGLGDVAAAARRRGLGCESWPSGSMLFSKVVAKLVDPATWQTGLAIGAAMTNDAGWQTMGVIHQRYGPRRRLVCRRSDGG